jgi:hypothetical protein
MSYYPMFSLRAQGLGMGCPLCHAHCGELHEITLTVAGVRGRSPQLLWSTALMTIGAYGASRAECHIMQVDPMGAGRRIKFRGVRVLGLRASTSPVLVPAEPGVIGETDGVRMYMHSSIC